MQFKPKFAAIALPLLASSFNVHAAPSAEVKVIGTIVPPSCTVILSGTGVFDYGKIVPGTAETDLGEKTLPFTIACASPAKIAIRAIDGRAAPTGSMGNKFSLGTVKTKRLGTYEMKMTKAVDELAGPLITLGNTNGGVGVWKNDDQLHTGNGPVTSWGVSAPAGAIPIKNLQGELAVHAKLADKANLPPLTEDIPLDGLATLELLYI